MHNRRIFVSGGSGVIGTALINLLLKQDADIFVGDLKPCPKEWAGKVKYRQGDLNTISAEELLDFDPEIFFHLAATFERAQETYPFFLDNFHHNVKLSHHLIHHLIKAKSLQSVLFASSYLIYDPALYLFSQKPSMPTSLSESSSIYPRNICGAAKLFHEMELRFMEQFHQKQTSFIAARIFRVYGRHSRDVISRWIRAALQEETLTVYGQQGQFDYIFADDVAEGLIRLALVDFSGVVNLGSGQARSIDQVLNILKQHFPSLKTQENPSSELLEASEANMELFKRITGWEPPHTLESAIPLMIEYERSNLTETKESPLHEAVLVTSISKKVPLLQAVKAAADKLGQFQCLHGCDSNETCIGQYCVDFFWHCPTLEHLSIEQILDYCQEHHVRIIIPTRDAELEFFSRYRQQLQQKGIEVMVPSLESVRICLDKKLFSDTLLKKNFPVIPSAISIADIHASKYVVKERFGAGSAKLVLNVSSKEAIEHQVFLQDPLFQPYIAGQEWSVDLYRSRQGKLMGCVARKRDVVVNGESQVTTTASYPALEKLCQEMAHVLQLEGHAIFQVIEDEQGLFHVIECNPRFGGASTASLAAGLDSFYWFFLECLGQNLQEYPFIRKKGDIRLVRYPSDWILPWSSCLT